MICPVCQAEINFENVQTHLFSDDTHRVFMATYLRFFQNIDENNIGDYLDPEDESENENTNYEYLSELCEQMGNHHIGMTKEKIDELVPVYIIDYEKKEENCPICLENISKMNTYARKIVKCKHIYCGECIETWLRENHTCPVCKIDIDPRENTVCDSGSGINDLD
jgi:Ring finger domain